MTPKQALTNAVNRASANGSPVYENIAPAPYHLLECGGAYRSPRIVGAYETFDAALSAAHELLPVAHFDLDDDHPGCADLITQFGSLYMIEPAERRD